MAKSRVFLFILLSFVAGVGLASFWLPPLFLVWLGFAAGAALAAGSLLGKRRKFWVYSLLVAALAAGILRFWQVQSALPGLSLLYGRELQTRAVITEEPEVTSKIQRLTVQVDEVEGAALDEPFLSLVTLGLWPRYRLGDELNLRGRLKEPENFTEDFDHRAHLAKDDIYSVFFFPEIEKIGENRAGSLKLTLSKFKHAFEEKIDRVLPEPHAAFLKGLTLGERRSLPEELVEDFNRTGVTHIIALSGYNITLVANFLLWFLVTFLTVPFGFAFWVATTGVGLFVLLTGASPSVTRAGVMGILVLLAHREGRLYSIRNALALAAAAMIFQNPKILRFDAAFQLSFLATLGLIYLSPHLDGMFEKIRARVYLWQGRVLPQKDPLEERNKFFPFRRILVETLSAQLAVLPLLIFLFGRVSLVSPVSNLLVILAVPYSMALGFAAGALGFLWTPLGEAAGWLAWFFLEYKITVIEFFAGIPAASLELGRWSAVLVALLYLVVFVRARTTRV